MTMEGHDDAIDRTLDTIRLGGAQLVAACRRRVAAALDALDAGDFGEAALRFTEVAHVLAPLAAAQAHVGLAGRARLVRVDELTVGDELADVGVITGLELRESCGHTKCPGHVKITVGEDEAEADFHGDQEVFVTLPDRAE